ncbi:MAG: S-layer homology domain-containing protein, partial [Paenibacillaceae bacterium]|nr:S-layer homology domain-containing protein [Paenibacillaceae bacterium]
MHAFIFYKPSRIIVSCLLVVAMLINLCPLNGASAEGTGAASSAAQLPSSELPAALPGFQDTNDHWAEKEIREWSNLGMISGFQDGTFRPDREVTRVEFATLVNRLFGFTEKAGRSPDGELLAHAAGGQARFPDVSPEDWFAAQVESAVQAGYMQGDSDGSFRPTQPLNRAEAAIIIARLVPMVALTGADPLSRFADRAAVPAYGRDALAGAVDAGYLAGLDDGTLRPGKAITRAEAVVLLDRVLGQSNGKPGPGFKPAPKQLAKAGTYGPASGAATVAGDLTLNAPGIVMQNVTVNGDLLIGEDVGEGDVYLRNVKVAGHTIVKGGGQNSVHIDDSDLSTIVIEKVGGRVRVVVGGTTVIEQMDIQSDATVESTGEGENVGIAGISISNTGEVTLSGNFKSVEVKSNVQLTVASGKIEHIQVNNTVTESTITLTEGVHVGQMEMNGGSSVEGKGTVDKAVVNATDVKFENKPAVVESTAPEPTATPTPAPTPTPTATMPATTLPSTPESTTPATPAPTPTPIVPDPPTMISVTAGIGQATIGFAPPANNGGSAITRYTVTSEEGGLTRSGDGSPITVTGLTYGTAYRFTVTATNAAGTSAASAWSAYVTPIAAPVAPDAPTITSVTAGVGQATVSFTPPANNGGSVITSYTVTSTAGGFTRTGTDSPITVTGLTYGQIYRFTVTATNTAGTSVASAPSDEVTPAAAPVAPDAPTITSVTAGNGQVTVNFTAPANNGGSAITSYTVTSTTGGITQTGTASPITVTGLTNGTAYSFTVTATNAAGTSEASAPSNETTPYTVPDAPTITSVTAGNGEATVIFTPP